MPGLKGHEVIARPNGPGNRPEDPSSERAKPPHSHVAIHRRDFVHFVFSTKNRERFIGDAVRDDLHAYIGGILQEISGVLLAAGSVQDHIHLLVSHPRTASPAEVVEAVKTGSSKWIKTKAPGLSKFAWQHGYGAFSISPSHRLALERYLAGQREHHAKVTFQDEYRRLLKKYNISYDERYVGD